jgi:hypothetical protein
VSDAIRLLEAKSRRTPFSYKHLAPTVRSRNSCSDYGELRLCDFEYCCNSTFSRTTLRATGAETLAAQHWATRLRLERNTVGLAALIANNFEPLALASALASSAEICSSRIPARFATFGMGQSALAIVILFSFSKRKARSTLGAGDL